MLGKCWEKKERKKGKNKENQWMKIGKKPLNKQISNTPPHQKKKKETVNIESRFNRNKIKEKTV